MDDMDKGWRERPAILAVLGALAALAVQQLAMPDRRGGVDAGREALAVAIGVGALAFGLAVERVRLSWTALFAGVAGATAGLVYWWSGGGGPFGDWRYLGLFLALAIALPLFQVARDEGAWRFPYTEVHGHAWTNALLWLAAWAFVGIAFLLAWLLASLFALIGLRFLRELLEEGWFWALLVGAAFGGALGLLRERDRVMRLLQRVAITVLGVLAPVLGVGLVVFLLALPFTGLGVLWETRAATATLLSAAAGALLLANAVIGDGPEEEARNPALRWAGQALAACVLPLAVIAAVATGLRLAQYGPTPERLWALVFVAIACAYGLAYLVSLICARAGWAGPARDANLRLAFGVAGLALLLATPLVSFNAIATNAQVARLKSGEVTPDKFDWAALAFDFGQSGKAALAELGRSADTRIAARAREAGRSTNRWEAAEEDRKATAQQELAARLRVLPRDVAVPPALASALTGWDACGADRQTRCTLIYTPGAREAFTINEACLASSRRHPASSPAMVVQPDCGIARLTWEGQAWAARRLGGTGDQTNDAIAAAQRAAIRAGDVQVRPVQRRQLYLGGRPIGEAFE